MGPGQTLLEGQLQRAISLTSLGTFIPTRRSNPPACLNQDCQSMAAFKRNSVGPSHFCEVNYDNLMTGDIGQSLTKTKMMSGMVPRPLAHIPRPGGSGPDLPGGGRAPPSAPPARSSTSGRGTAGPAGRAAACRGPGRSGQTGGGWGSGQRVSPPHRSLEHKCTLWSINCLKQTVLFGKCKPFASSKKRV